MEVFSVKADVLIVGQGLAGSLLAWKFLERGLRILVVDKDEESTSSKVAAGLVTPLAGSRFNLPEELEERLTHAKQFYWDVEEATGTRLFHHLKIARLFRTPQENDAWNKRLATDAERYRPWHNSLNIDQDKFLCPDGGMEMNGGGWLDVPRFLDATRQRLIECAAYAIATVKSDDIEVSDKVVRWKNVEADRVVFCEGWRGNKNRFFDWLPMNPAAGDILDLRIPDLAPEDRILNKGGWLLPIGDELFRAGSTYRSNLNEEDGIEKGRNEILEKIAGITSADYEVVAIKTAIRPIIRRSQIFMGTHPSQPRVLFFNGLGSKGVLNGPWHAEKFVGHLLDKDALPSETDIRSNFA